MIKAVVDIGTNSIRLLIAEVKGETMNVLKTALKTTRIGEGTGQTGRLSEIAIRRTVEGLAEYQEMLQAYDVKNLTVAATSAVRDAENRAAFLKALKERTGWDVTVLKGEEEAYYSYLGATKGLPGKHDNTIVVDIGGGSTEFVWPHGDGIKCASLRLGAVRMTEKSATLQDIQETLTDLPVDFSEFSQVRAVGVGGTFTTLAAIDQELSFYIPEKVHGYKIQKKSMERILASLEKMSLEQRRQLPGLQPERADIIIAGVRIALSVAQRLGIPEITVSEADIMYGLLYNA